ncbi:hypothetical protein like AT3G57950 [Hibiscus trionum]|uniref:Cotton fiber protein n=1 Tax=Hibiscus trionum TaxID=183268 RepID=A0A9W7GSL8_HIBTR|nr:hypothetical protein like AT3G57950 [Hibiscus trionum]
MVGPSYIKTLLPFQSISMKPPSSSTSTSMKIRTLTHTLIHAQLRHLIRAFSKAKSLVVRIYKENKPIKYLISNSKATKKKHNKLLFGSFRLHYNWCSSHVAPVLKGCTATHLYYDSVIPTEQCESELSGYLQWVEEKKVNSSGETDMNEIDKLAEMFIADCYEKFRLEKQESYRRFQEMMATSV